MASRDKQSYNGYRLSDDEIDLVGPDRAILKVRRQTLDVFKCLSLADGKGVSKQTLFEQVWPSKVVGDDSLTKCISELRQLLRDNDRSTLQTIPKYGYRLVSDQSSLPIADINPTGQKETSIIRKNRAFNKFAIPALMGFAFLLMLIGAASGIFRSTEGTSNIKPAMAVIDFQDLTGIDRWSRLTTGITSDLVAELSKNSWLRLTHLSVETDLTDTLRKSINPKYSLTGTLQSDTDQLRITAQLKQIDTDEVVWSKRWDKPADRIFEVQDSIIESTNASLAAEWTGHVAKADNRLANRNHPKNLDAYELYLLGVEQKHKFTDEGNRLATEYFQKALAIDPEYGQAWSAQSIVYMNSWTFADSWDAKLQLVDKQKHASRKAFDLLPNDPTVMVTYSYVTAHDKNHIKTDELLTDAVKSAWNNPDLLMYAAWAGSGRTTPDVPVDAWAERGIMLHTEPPAWYSFALATAQFFRKKPAQALATLQTAPETTDRWWVEAGSLAALGRIEEAKAIADKYRAVEPNFSAKNANAIMPIPDEQKLKWYRENLGLAGL